MERNILSCDTTEEPPSTDPHLYQPSSFALADDVSIFGKPKELQITAEDDSCQQVSSQHEAASRTLLFRRKWYPAIKDTEWNNWLWQLKNRINTYESLNAMLRLSEDERCALLFHHDRLPIAITPYYLSLLDPNNSNHPLRRTVIPVMNETIASQGEAEDPLSESQQSPVPGLVHRYPDRVLFLVSNLCACYCRYCTRSRMVGQCNKKHAFTRDQWEQSIAYIEAHPEIRDVLVSGGDPLMLPNEALVWILERLRRIPHIEIIRIGTKAPVVLPQRITPSLVSVLKRFHPLWMSIHFTHPDELTPEVKDACERLANGGIPLGSQTVLLKGINDDCATQKKLYHGLMMNRVRPYYLYQCDPIVGSSHFRTPVQTGVDIIHNLHGHTSGYAVPHFVIDAPGGGGKIPITPNNTAGRDGNDLLIKNFQGNIYRYPDCC